MKKTKKMVVVSVVLMSLMFSTVYAYGVQQEALLNSINISVNGEKIAQLGESYTLSNGTKVPYSINYAGTTYLPMREVAKLLNKDVTYDKETRTANIVDKPGSELLPPLTASSRLIYDAEGTPELECIIYNLSDKDIKSYTFVMHCYDKNLVPVIEKNKNNNILVLGERDVEFKANESVEKFITLEGFEDTEIYQLVVDDVTFADGTVWNS